MASYSRFEDIPLFKYGMIKADPPWHHQFYSEAGSDRSPEAHYGTMSLKSILDLPVGDLCGANAVLWLWIPGCMVNRAHLVFDAWGFEFVTSGFWGKSQKSDPAKLRMGTGYVMRDCGEPFWIGKIGQPEFLDRAIPSAFLEPRREHSRKPERSYELAERLAPKGYPKLDLFSRQAREGWDNFGDEHDKFDNRDGGCGQADGRERTETEKDGGRPSNSGTHDAQWSLQI